MKKEKRKGNKKVKLIVIAAIASDRYVPYYYYNSLPLFIRA